MNDMAMNKYIAMIMDRQIKFKFLFDLKGVPDLQYPIDLPSLDPTTITYTLQDFDKRWS